MSSTIKNVATGFGLSILYSLAAHADGVDPMYKADGSYIDDLEIIGDVTMPSGETFAVLEMREQRLKFYVDPNAVYVTMHNTNPIITGETPFYGFWVSTQSIDIADWPACENEVLDEYGSSYLAHGTLVWTNTGIADNGYDLAYNIELGTCNQSQEPWAYSGAALELLQASGVPHDDISTEDHYIVVDANGLEYLVDINDIGATLISREPREIVVEMADERSTSETFVDHEVLEMYTDCSASSMHRGFGTWSWSNGGFVIDFDTVGFSFPRMDAPVEDNGDCRM